MKGICLVLVFLCSQTTFAIQCSTGGATPIGDFSSNIFEKTEFIPTNGSLSEFITWDELGEIVYRTEDKTLYSLQSSTFSHTQLKKKVNTALASLSDEQNRFILTETHWYYDRLTIQNFKSFKVEPAHSTQPQLNHLFWHGEQLYTLALTQKGLPNTKLYQYTAGQYNAKLACESAGQTFALAKGHEYPYIYLYQELQNRTSTKIKLFRWHVETCAIEEDEVLEWPEARKVKSVFRFPKIGAFAVQLAQSDRDAALIWVSQNECEFYALENQDTYFLHNRIPFVASWDATRGLNLIHLGAGKRASVLSFLPLADLGPQNIRLNRDGNKLYLAPRTGPHSPRTLYRLTLKDDAP